MEIKILQPYVPTLDEILTYPPFPFPYLGPYRPAGWDLVWTWVYGTTGFTDNHWEHQVSPQQLKLNLIEWLEDKDSKGYTYGFGILEASETQGRIGVFRKVEPVRTRHTCLTPLSTLDAQLDALDSGLIETDDEMIAIFQRVINEGKLDSVREYHRRVIAMLLHSGFCHERVSVP